MGMTVSGASVLDVDELPHQGHVASPNPLTNGTGPRTATSSRSGSSRPTSTGPSSAWPSTASSGSPTSGSRPWRTARVNSAACVAMLDELFAERTLAEWEEVLLAGQDGQWDVFLKAGRVRYDEQVQANEFAQLVEHDGDGKVVLVPAPAQFDGEVTRSARPGARGRHRRRAGRARLRRRGDRRPPRARRRRLSSNHHEES